MKTAMRRSIASLLVVSVTGLGMPSPVQAGTVGTEEAIAAKRDRIAGALDRPEVRAALEARGVSATDARARVEAMTDDEVAHIAANIDTLPAGGFLAGVAYMAAIAVTQVILLIGALASAIVRDVRNSKAASTQSAADKPFGDVTPLPAR